MTSKPSIKSINNQQGFTLIEIIAVLVLLGILAAVAVPKYMDLTNTARNKAAMGQIAEVKGRLSSGLNGYMLANDGAKPANGAALVTYVNSATVSSSSACPTSYTTEGDFSFKCTGGTGTATTVTIDVESVQGTTLTNDAGTATPVSETYTF